MPSDFLLPALQTVLAALAGALTVAMARALRRRSAPEWWLSWFALVAYLVFGFVHVSPEAEPLARAINVVARVMESSSGALQVGLLVAVAWIYVRMRPLPRRVFQGLALASLGLGVALALVLGGEPSHVHDVVVGRVGTHSVLTAAALPITAAWLLFARLRATTASTVLSVVYLLFGAVALLKIAYVMGLVSRFPPSITPEFVGLMDVARYTALGLAAALILVERLEAQAATSAEDATRAREAKDLSDSWFKTLVENAQEIVVMVDPSGRCRYASQSVTRIAGWPATDLVGEDLFQHVHPDESERVRAAFRELWTSARDSLPVSFRFRKLTGTYITVEATGVRLPAGNGSAADTCHIIIARDVTARLEAADRERQLAQQLYRAQKTESLGRLAGGVAHDFNNLLTAIYGHASVAQRLLPHEHPATKDLAEVERAVRRAGALTRQLLQYSQRKVTDRTALELDRVVADLTMMLSRIVGETIQFETDLGAPGAFVMADRGQLEQVLVNLVVNARDAMADGGRLRVETRCLRDRPTGSPGSPDVTDVLMTVSDTGKGIPPEIRDLIFEPFFTTKAQQGGTGLGLATSEGIVHQHQGRIWLESTEQGTRFCVSLPLIERPVATTAAVQQQARPRIGPGRVLLVEDESAVRHVAAAALRDHGYHVVEFGDPVAARITAAREPFDLMVTDVVMPRLSGLALANYISAVHPRIKILFISGYSQETAEVGAASRLSGHRFLPKPFHPDDLTMAAGELLADRPAPSS
jgi:PAS domain S-box-containing protein